VAAIKQSNYNKSAEGTAEKVNKLSNEIYKLNEQSVAIDNITNSFDKLDNKIIKTKEDVAEMSELLAQAGEQMNNDEVDDKKNEGFGKGVNEKEHYESLSDEGKRKYLEDKQAQIDAELRDKRQDQIDLINNMSSSERDKFLDENTTNNEIRAAQDAIYELNKQTVYDTIDALKDQNAITNEVAAATENLTRSMLDNLSVKDS
jgi:hypothetical protein